MHEVRAAARPAGHATPGGPPRRFRAHSGLPGGPGASLACCPGRLIPPGIPAAARAPTPRAPPPTLARAGDVHNLTPNSAAVKQAPRRRNEGEGLRGRGLGLAPWPRSAPSAALAPAVPGRSVRESLAGRPQRRGGLAPCPSRAEQSAGGLPRAGTRGKRGSAAPRLSPSCPPPTCTHARDAGQRVALPGD